MAESDLYFQRYLECEELYKQAKYTQCTKLALDNLMGTCFIFQDMTEECADHGLRDTTDSTMPRYFPIKTLSLLVGAKDDDWDKAEVYHYQLSATSL
jgi:hypothetical protein